MLFGPLPVALINTVLGTELEAGIVRLTAQAHGHMAEKHPADYAACIAALPEVVTAPSFIGQAPGHAGNFELVRRVARPDGCAVLVAVGLERDSTGFYRVRTSYLINTNTLDSRRRAGRLIAPPRP